MSAHFHVRVRHAWSFGSPLGNNLGAIVAASRSKGSTTPLMVLANFTPVFPPWFQELGRLIGFSSAVCLKETSRQRRFPREQRERLISFKIDVKPNNTLKTPSSGLNLFIRYYYRNWTNIFPKIYSEFLDLNSILFSIFIFFITYIQNQIYLFIIQKLNYIFIILNNIQNTLASWNRLSTFASTQVLFIKNTRDPKGR